MRNIISISLPFVLLVLLMSSISTQAQSVPSDDNEKSGDEKLQQIKENVARSAREGDVKILLEKTYRPSLLDHKAKVKIEAGKTYDILAVMSGEKGELKTTLWNKKGIDSWEYRSKQFEEDGLMYSGHSIKRAKKSEEFTLQVSAKKTAKGAKIYLAMVEYIEDETAEADPDDHLDTADKFNKKSLRELGYIAAYTPKDFIIRKASELPVILEMEVHEGNDYRVMASFSTTKATPKVIVADPKRGKGQSEGDDIIASFEIRTVHKGVQKYYIQVSKVEGTLQPDDKVYIYTGYRTSTNTEYPYKAVNNSPEDHFSKE